MASFRFLHCADLHLDSPLRGLEADAPAEKIRGATREALANLVDYVIENRLEFVVAAGDLYDGDWQDWRTGHFLVGQIARLSRERIPFIAIRGNHDAESVITRRLELRGEFTRMLDHRRPETFRLASLPVSIHGQSFATKAVTENIARGYPAPDPDRFNIGLLHSSIDGREGHANYAPCTLEQLRDHGYDYWALGHVHEREILSHDPWIVFPGNLQGRHINETGQKGASLVTVTDGKVVDAAPISFDTVQWARIPVVLTADADEEIALAQVRAALSAAFERANGRLLAARISVSGACVAHDSFSRDLGAAREKIRGEALNVAGPGMIWTETVEIATTAPAKVTEQRERPDAIGQLIRALETIGDDVVLDDIRTYAAAMLDKSNPLRQAIGDQHAATNDALSRDLIRRARELLLGSMAE
ncbi:MAG: DNA repair exonuclease [Acetobacteraceae bacterium]|nr:DNA repair exonuclease [Acetobacteraceae bacterium]